MRRYVIINFGGLVICLAYPMAPPWMASEEGWLDADATRINGRGWHDIGLGRFDPSANPVARFSGIGTRRGHPVITPDTDAGTSASAYGAAALAARAAPVTPGGVRTHGRS